MSNMRANERGRRPAGKQVFTFQEIATEMLKARGISEGIWELGFEFGQQAIKINDPAGQTLPAAVSFIVGIHLARVEAMNGLAVDAERIGAIIVVR